MDLIDQIAALEEGGNLAVGGNSDDGTWTLRLYLTGDHEFTIYYHGSLTTAIEMMYAAYDVYRNTR